MLVYTKKNWKKGFKELFSHLEALFTIAQVWKQPINRCMDKQNVLYTSVKYYPAIERKESPDTCYSMDKLYAKWNKPVTKSTTTLGLYLHWYLEQSNS
jgi:hypothetical protein